MVYVFLAGSFQEPTLFLMSGLAGSLQEPTLFLTSGLAGSFQEPTLFLRSGLYLFPVTVLLVHQWLR